MKSAATKEIRTALNSLEKKELIALVDRLIRYRKENKELTAYLLFDSEDELSYVQGIKDMIQEDFRSINVSALYFAKKSIRKIIRITGKYIRYSGRPDTEIELLIFLCRQILELKLDIRKSMVLQNMYNGLIKKIKKIHQELHEDLQYEFDKIIPEIDQFN